MPDVALRNALWNGYDPPSPEVRMDQASLGWFRMHLENRFLKARRDEFQGLVCQILERRYPGDFKRIRQGTRKAVVTEGVMVFALRRERPIAVYASRDPDDSGRRIRPGI